MSYNDAQPMPIGDGPEVSPSVQSSVRKRTRIAGALSGIAIAICRDLQERIDWGTKKYKTPLRAFNGRDAKVDYYQEMLDALHYAGQDCMEHPGDQGATSRFERTIELVVSARMALWVRDGK